jgi:demethylspheroidene O-methyltransferase
VTPAAYPQAGGATSRATRAGKSWPASERWRDWRNRLLASARFQRWAAAFPLTRPIARRRARELFDLCAGFVYSQVLLACVRLRLFDHLAGEPLSCPELATRMALPPDAAARLLAAAASLRLLECRGDDRFALGPLGATLVGNDAVLAMIEHHALLYADLADPVALLRGETQAAALAAYWPYARASDPSQVEPARVAAYSALMSASQPLVADEILDAYSLRRHRCLLDVGGGDGAFAAAAARRAPHLRLVLFDLPAVAALAQSRLDAAGLGARAQVVGGNFLVDPLPAGADVASLVRVIHDHDDASALAVLRAVRRALAQDGTLLLAEPMAGMAGAEPIGDAYFGFYLLAMGRGRARTPAELEALLRTAGFGRVERAPTRQPLQTGLLVARAK